MAVSKDDSNEMRFTLLKISENHRKDTITDQFIEIQSSQVSGQKSLDFLENLECLYLLASRGQRDDTQPSFLRRCTINPFKQPRYVALSYTCNTAVAIERSWLCEGA